MVPMSFKQSARYTEASDVDDQVLRLWGLWGDPDPPAPDPRTARVEFPGHLPTEYRKHQEEKPEIPGPSPFRLLMPKLPGPPPALPDVVVERKPAAYRSRKPIKRKSRPRKPSYKEVRAAAELDRLQRVVSWLEEHEGWWSFADIDAGLADLAPTAIRRAIRHALESGKIVKPAPDTYCRIASSLSWLAAHDIDDS